MTAVALDWPAQLPAAYRDTDGRALSWHDQALCAQTDPEAFFPEKGGSVKEAKRVCRNCEVRAECLEYALENDERFGVWGGLSERERRRLNRPASPAAAQPEAKPARPGTTRARSSAKTPGRETPGPDAVRAWRPRGEYGWKPAKKGLAA